MGICATAQYREVTKPDNTTNINKTDAGGKKHGVWLFSYGERMGEPSISEFGNYDHGVKMGKWYKIDNEGELVSVETFKNDVLDGEAKYYDQGKLSVSGTYRGMKPDHDYDTVVIVDPISQRETLKAVATEKGTVRHGLWKYYEPRTGKIVKEEDYQMDQMLHQRRFDLTKEDSLRTQQQIKNLPHSKDDKSKGGKDSLDYRSKIVADTATKRRR